MNSMPGESQAQLNIVAYCCEHCAYAAADLAGGLRLQYPPAIKIVQVPCTGRLDVLNVLHAIEDGADGVMVAG
jgi:F420-non-reducing hydrogenase iron-sulfur subunit